MSPADLSNVDWGRVFAKAVDIAHGFTRRDAEDVVEDGMERLFSGEAPWDASSGRTLAEHLVAVGRNARLNRMRTERRRRSARVLGTLAQMFEEDGARTPEEDVEERENQKLLLGRLLEDLSEDPEARTIVFAELDGVHDALEQARQYGMDIETVRRARRRIARSVRTLVQRAEQAEQDEAAS